MKSKESDVKHEKQELPKQNTNITYGERYWMPILLITIGLGSVGIVFVIYGSSQIIESYNMTESVNPIGFNNTVFPDTFPDTPLAKFVNLHIENNENRLLLTNKLVFTSH